MNLKKIITAISLFIIVFCIYAFALKENWFWGDDLGIILNGLIKNWHDFIRVFTEDMRAYVATYNYNFPTPNVFSGFLRPLQNIFFSITYFLFGLNPYAFYLLQIFFHALNVSLIFILFSYWLSIPLAFCGGLFCGFFPFLGWFLWLAALQNNCTITFLLIALLLFIYWYKNQTKNWIFVLAGFNFFLSLLAREIHIFLPFWILLIILIFYAPTNKSFFYKVFYSLKCSWIFFAGSISYTLLKLYSFGLGSLPRTLNNRLIDSPWLQKIVSLFPTIGPQQSTQTIIDINNKIAATAAVNSTAALDTSTAAEQITNLFSSYQPKLLAWTQAIFNFSPKNWVTCLFLYASIAIFLFIAYKNNRTIMSFLLLSIPFFMWPSLITYPAQRYIHSAYPLLIFIALLGIQFLIQSSEQKLLRWGIALFTSFFIGISFLNSFVSIITCLNNNHVDLSKNAYIQFFRTNSLPKGANIVAIGTAYESDMERCFQLAGNDFSLRLAHEPMSMLSETGSLECKGDYKAQGVKSTVTPIENGFRFISHDKRCSWFFHHYQPVRWSEEERAYIRHPEPYKAHEWYPCSIGKFYIHEIFDQLYVTDFSLVIDQKWRPPNTVFISWDTLDGKYIILDSSHINNTP